MKRYLNLEAIIEGCLCLAFSGLMFYMAYSGKYLLFVTPRMKPYLYFSAGMLLLWGISRFKRAGRPKYKVHLAKCLVLVIPLLVIFFPYSPMALDTSAQYSNESKGSSGTKGSSESNKEGTEGRKDIEKDQQGAQGTSQQQSDNFDNNGQTQQDLGEEKSKSGFKTKAPSELDEDNRIITVEHEKFYQWLIELDQHPGKYEGYTIQIHGTILRDEGMNDNEFALGRMMMSCCVADLSYCKIICEWKGAADLKAERWVDVSGKVYFDEGMNARIKVNEIKDAYPPDEQYVYPFTY